MAGALAETRSSTIIHAPRPPHRNTGIWAGIVLAGVVSTGVLLSNVGSAIRLLSTDSHPINPNPDLVTPDKFNGPQLDPVEVNRGLAGPTENAHTLYTNPNANEVNLFIRGQAPMPVNGRT